MKSQRLSAHRAEDLCAGLRPGDGINFKEDKKERERGNRAHEDERFCGHLRKILNASLGGLAVEPLSSLVVEGVYPDPDTYRLRVEVGPVVPGMLLSASEVASGLAAAKSRLRQDVAESISRKRAPDLVFKLACQEGGNP